MRKLIKENIAIIIILILFLVIFSSCSTSKITQRQIKINYELDKLYIDYNYKRDSLINEYYTK
tara:strand:+ start:163 stop:351 length:189 start_codon:yes stop_codon:yes gene_type:complete